MYDDSLTMFMVFQLPKSYFPEFLKLFSHYAGLHIVLSFMDRWLGQEIFTNYFTMRIGRILNMPFCLVIWLNL